MEDNIRKIKISADSMSTALRIIKERYGADAYILHEEEKDSRVHLIVATGDRDDNLIESFREAEDLEQENAVVSIGASSKGNLESDKLTIEEIPNDKRMVDLTKEVESIKAYLEHHIPKIIFQKYESDSAIKSLILKKMLSNGYSLQFANKIVNSLPSNIDVRNYLSILKEKLTKSVNSTNLMDIVQGKKVIFVGAGGAGKTTAIIKLLKTLVKRQSPDNINVVGMPSNCIAEHEPLKRYSEIMSCNFIELAKASQEDMTFICKPNTTTLIDTAQYIHNKTTTIHDVKRIVKILRNQVLIVLVMSAGTNLEMMEKIISSMKEHVSIDGIILTKMDEVEQVGGMLEQTIDNNLTILGLVNSEDKTQPMCLPKDDELVLKTLDNAVNSKFTEVSFINSSDINNIGVNDAV